MLKRVLCGLICLASILGAAAYLPVTDTGDTPLVLRASAELSGNTVRTSDCTYSFEVINYYSIGGSTGVETIRLTGAEPDGDIIDIPGSIDINGNTYEVRELGTGFAHDARVSTIIIPDTVTAVYDDFAKGSSVRSLTVSKNIKTIGRGFCSDCTEITSVKYSGSSIQELGQNAFLNSEHKGYGYSANSKGAVTLGNWLIRYTGTDEELRVCELGEDTLIDSMADHSLYSKLSLKTLDLEGIKHIGAGAMQYCNGLEEIKNADDVEFIGDDALNDTPWLDTMSETGTVMLGKALYRYITESSVIDLTQERFSGIKFVSRYAFEGCRNAHTFKVRSDITLAGQCFYMREGCDLYDKVPAVPHCTIRNVYLDGVKVEYSFDKPCLPEWIHDNYSAFIYTAFELENAAAKTKDIFEQMDIEYYGIGNDKMGTHTPEEEFYINLKIHNYIATFPVSDAQGDLDSFLTGYGYSCMGYSGLTEYLLESAGVRAGRLNEVTHAWTCTQIGEDWFQTDAGWDEQSGCRFAWSFLSDKTMAIKDPDHHVAHYVTSIHRSTYATSSPPPNFGKTIGDVNNDDIRNAADAELMWSYVRGEDVDIDEENADVDRDGKIDITDAVLTDRFVKGKSIDRSLIDDDRMAPGYYVALINDEDYNEIQYMMTRPDGTFTLPENIFEETEGKKLVGWDMGDIGESVRLTRPYTVIRARWEKLDEEENDTAGDVNGDGVIDIEDAVSVIMHINGIRPLTDREFKRADVSKDESIMIDDAVLIINYINGHLDF